MSAAQEIEHGRNSPGLLGDPRRQVAFPALTKDHIEALRPFGTIRQVPKGEVLWNVGDAHISMFVVTSGEVGVYDGRSGHLITKHIAGGFSGDIDVLSGRPAVVTARAEIDVEVMEIPGECVRAIVGELPLIGEIILKAFLARRAIMQEMSMVGPLVVGSRFSADTLRIREFLARNRFPNAWEDLEASPHTTKILADFEITEADTPIVVCPNGDVLHTPSNIQLAEALGIISPVEDKLYDLVVVGAGPAGLAAAVYGASEGLSTLVIDSEGPGGQAGTSSRIENYMGFPNGISGRELADQAVVQAERFGAELMIARSAVDLVCTDVGGHFIDLVEGSRIQSRCVLVATGAKYRRLEADIDGKFEGRGLYYAATNIERLLCRDDEVAVVGAGNSAGQAAVFMAEHSRHVYLVVRGNDLRKSMSSYLATRIERSSTISVLLNSEIVELEGEDCLQGAQICDVSVRKQKRYDIKGVFVMIGAAPNAEWLPKLIARDAKGFVLTGLQLVRDGRWKHDRAPFYLETSCPGVFAAGDVRAESVKRVASAVGEGSMAVAFVHQFLTL